MIDFCLTTLALSFAELSPFALEAAAAADDDDDVAVLVTKVRPFTYSDLIFAILGA